MNPAVLNRLVALFKVCLLVCFVCLMGADVVVGEPIDPSTDGDAMLTYQR